MQLQSRLNCKKTFYLKFVVSCQDLALSGVTPTTDSKNLLGILIEEELSFQLHFTASSQLLMAAGFPERMFRVTPEEV